MVFVCYPPSMDTCTNNRSKVIQLIPTKQEKLREKFKQHMGICGKIKCHLPLVKTRLRISSFSRIFLLESPLNHFKIFFEEKRKKSMEILCRYEFV